MDLRPTAHGAEVGDPVADDVGILVNVTEEHAANPVAGGQQRLVEVLAVDQPHPVIPPGRSHRQDVVMHRHDQRAIVLARVQSLPATPAAPR